jgi:hypothetical protein
MTASAAKEASGALQQAATMATASAQLPLARRRWLLKTVRPPAHGQMRLLGHALEGLPGQATGAVEGDEGPPGPAADAVEARRHSCPARHGERIDERRRRARPRRRLMPRQAIVDRL